MCVCHALSALSGVQAGLTCCKGVPGRTSYQLGTKYTSVLIKLAVSTRDRRDSTPLVHATSKHATESRRRIALTVGLVSARKHPADGADTY